MFTGIIESLGAIKHIEKTGNDARFLVKPVSAEFEIDSIGDSVSVSGVCLTVVENSVDGMLFDVSGETLTCTSLTDRTVGDEVNLERAVTPSTRLGGHLVSGHVDGVGHLRVLHEDGRSTRMSFEVPKELARYVASKGSVCIDGISLTVNEVDGNTFGVNIIPHTMDVTTMHNYRVGDAVNIEVDVIARYLERLMNNND